MPIINDLGKMAALDIMDEIVEAVQENEPHGITFKEGARLTDLSYNEFYRAIHSLAWLNKIKVVRGFQGHYNRIVLPEWEGPARLYVSDLQRKVLDLLCQRANAAGLVRISSLEISKIAGVKSPYDKINTLDKKGFLEVLERGGPTEAALYKVFPEGNGPQGYSYMPIAPRPNPWFMDNIGRIKEFRNAKTD